MSEKCRNNNINNDNKNKPKNRNNNISEDPLTSRCTDGGNKPQNQLTYAFQISVRTWPAPSPRSFWTRRRSRSSWAGTPPGWASSRTRGWSPSRRRRTVSRGRRSDRESPWPSGCWKKKKTTFFRVRLRNTQTLWLLVMQVEKETGPISDSRFWVGIWPESGYLYGRFPDSTRRGNKWKRGHNDEFKMH